MSKYVCDVCGYVYDPADGDAAVGVAPGTAWEELPADWVCPVCGADKDMFTEVAAPAAQTPAVAAQAGPAAEPDADDAMFISARLSSLARGCSKMYLAQESEFFGQLARDLEGRAPSTGSLDELSAMLDWDVGSGYAEAFQAARQAEDRGALRALTWGEKVSKMQQGLLNRYLKQGDAAFEGSNLYVCEACGFLYAGDEAPDICPVCKVPAFKFSKIARGA